MMPILRRFANRMKFELERFVVRGAIHRLLFIALLIGLVSVVAGELAQRAAHGHFASDGEAIWWAFLRLTDPGYLGDDQGAGLRTISTIVTIAGYVIFLGALVAIMTQWLNATMAKLESGLTPIAANDHVVILGYSTRTASIVRELLLSEGRVERFLEAHGASRLKIVILAEHVNLEVVQELKDRLGDLWRPRQISLRTGNPLRLDHLNRVDFLHASAILLPALERPGEQASLADERTIKSLLAISSSRGEIAQAELPLIVAEIADSRRVSIAARAYGGPIELLASDDFVGRLLVQTVRYPGISAVYEELLAPARENEVYIRALPELDGLAFARAARSFPRAIILGILRPSPSGVDSILAPPRASLIEPGDQLVFLASSFDACKLSTSSDASLLGEGVVDTTELPKPLQKPRGRRVLVLGWNHKVPALLRELTQTHLANGVNEIDVVSTIPRTARESQTKSGGGTGKVRHVECDYTLPGELARLDPSQYDNVVFAASDWAHSEYESDARTLLGHLLLEDVLAGQPKRPSIVVELMASENVPLLAQHDVEIIVSPELLSHILTQVALRRDLHAVYTDLFVSGGGDFAVRPVSEYALARHVSFADVSAAVASYGEIAVGVRHGKDVALNPPPERTWSLTQDDEIIVVTRFEDPEDRPEEVDMRFS